MFCSSVELWVVYQTDSALAIKKQTCCLGGLNHKFVRSQRCQMMSFVDEAAAIYSDLVVEVAT